MFLLWIFLIRNPEGFNQFGMKDTFDKTSTTAILTIKDNFGASVLGFEFYELRPISVPSIPLDYTTEGDEITLDITWSYTYFMPKTPTGENINLTLYDL